MQAKNILIYVGKFIKNIHMDSDFSANPNTDLLHGFITLNPQGFIVIKASKFLLLTLQKELNFLVSV